MDDTQLPYIFADSLIANYHPMLAEAQIIIGYNYGWKPNRDGRIILATVSIINDFDRQLHNKDIKILLNYNYWHNPETNDDNRNALIDHQLSHPRPVMDKDLAIPVRNDMGMIKYYLREHDLEDFNDVVARWGIWMIEMEKSAEIMAAAWDKEKKERAAKSDAELEEDSPDADPDAELDEEVDDDFSEEPEAIVTYSR
jgi:hypothetical protein